jgi:hypothetical protein
MPPKAAAMDSAATRGFLSSPRTSSRLSSNATTKKNSVISPSLIQSRAEWRRANGPISNPTGISQKAKKPWAQDESERASAVSGAHQQDAARSLDAQEPRKRSGDPIDRFPGQQAESWVVVVLPTHPCHPRCRPGVCSDVTELPQRSDESGPQSGLRRARFLPCFRVPDLHEVHIHITRTIPWSQYADRI